jgi:hypothetical protein
MKKRFKFREWQVYLAIGALSFAGIFADLAFRMLSRRFFHRVLGPDVSRTRRQDSSTARSAIPRYTFFICVLWESIAEVSSPDTVLSSSILRASCVA